MAQTGSDAHSDARPVLPHGPLDPCEPRGKAFQCVAVGVHDDGIPVELQGVIVHSHHVSERRSRLKKAY